MTKSHEDLLSIISKSKNRLVLCILQEYSKIYFGKLLKISKLPKVSLIRALNELVDAGLVQKEIEDPTKRTSKVYYSLTELGKKAIKIYDFVEELEKERKSSKMFVS